MATKVRWKQILLQVLLWAATQTTFGATLRHNNHQPSHHHKHHKHHHSHHHGGEAMHHQDSQWIEEKNIQKAEPPTGSHFTWKSDWQQGKKVTVLSISPDSSRDRRSVLRRMESNAHVRHGNKMTLSESSHSPHHNSAYNKKHRNDRDIINEVYDHELFDPKEFKEYALDEMNKSLNVNPYTRNYGKKNMEESGGKRRDEERSRRRNRAQELERRRRRREKRKKRILARKERRRRLRMRVGYSRREEEYLRKRREQLMARRAEKRRRRAEKRRIRRRQRKLRKLEKKKKMEAKSQEIIMDGEPQLSGKDACQFLDLEECSGLTLWAPKVLGPQNTIPRCLRRKSFLECMQRQRGQRGHCPPTTRAKGDIAALRKRIREAMFTNSSCIIAESISG